MNFGGPLNPEWHPFFYILDDIVSNPGFDDFEKAHADLNEIYNSDNGILMYDVKKLCYETIESSFARLEEIYNTIKSSLIRSANHCSEAVQNFINRKTISFFIRIHKFRTKIESFTTQTIAYCKFLHNTIGELSNIMKIKLKRTINNWSSSKKQQEQSIRNAPTTILDSILLATAFGYQSSEIMNTIKTMKEEAKSTTTTASPQRTTEPLEFLSTSTDDDYNDRAIDLFTEDDGISKTFKCGKYCMFFKTNGPEILWPIVDGINVTILDPIDVKSQSIARFVEIWLYSFIHPEIPIVQIYALEVCLFLSKGLFKIPTSGVEIARIILEVCHEIFCFMLIMFGIALDVAIFLISQAVSFHEAYYLYVTIAAISFIIYYWVYHIKTDPHYVFPG